jgi:hypothetical protein
MYQTQHVIGISQHPIAPWVKDLVGRMLHGSVLKVSVMLENFTTQFNLFKRHDDAISVSSMGRTRYLIRYLSGF